MVRRNRATILDSNIFAKYTIASNLKNWIKYNPKNNWNIFYNSGLFANAVLNLAYTRARSRDRPNIGVKTGAELPWVDRIAVKSCTTAGKTKKLQASHLLTIPNMDMVPKSKVRQERLCWKILIKWARLVSICSCLVVGIHAPYTLPINPTFVWSTFD